ncbi:MAG: hypothetical protein H6Q15_367 [Bacteroidetes bacterium]|nr:hypothetical protein [Bacteroidota bacterium]
MNKAKRDKVNKLRKEAQFVLFATSYLPLFVLIILKQISENYSYFHWGGLDFNAIILFMQKFGLSTMLLIISLIGIAGCKLLFENLERLSPNGENVTVCNIDNKNSESIGYIATYIVPFLFQSFNGWYELIALFFLLVIIYRIYINSNLILINPILSFKYSLFEIEYKQQNGKLKNGLIITKDRRLEEDSIIKIYEIGFKLFYGRNKQ